MSGRLITFLGVTPRRRHHFFLHRISYPSYTEEDSRGEAAVEDGVGCSLSGNTILYCMGYCATRKS